MWEGRRQAVCSHSVRRVINFSPGCRSPAAPALWLRAFPAPLHLQRRNYSCWDLPLSRAISGLLPGTCTSLPPPPSTPTPFPALLPPCTPLILPAFSSSRQLQTRTPLFSFAGCSWEGGGDFCSVPHAGGQQSSSQSNGTRRGRLRAPHHHRAGPDVCRHFPTPTPRFWNWPRARL